ncbi:Wadjet anti-phage system protein JetD domain-containing protein [uncultured Desulfuromonas sp.]|uniref:Wadjet anti-phage system protein JetD domain-containing protein n=1 Tax=uncultured Desulfuromonas sp. TaxID=181013 RepID=UPI002AAAE7B2|nr:Wadjet anti-phage system protein JetD domain-containing protein [uncultured Desulfuromonas sp.]
MPPALELLKELLTMWEESPDGTRKKVLHITKKKAPAYYRTVDPDLKNELHEGLNSAAKTGAVLLTWGKFTERHLLKKITLENPRTLADHLGVTLAVDRVDGYRHALTAGIPSDFLWGTEIVEEILKKWRTASSYNRIDPGNVDAALNLIRALWHIEAGNHQGLDLRTFSAKFLGNSKTMESISGLFSKVWQQHYGGDLSPTELYESMGLCKFPQPVFIKGPLKMEVAGGHIDCSQIRSYVGFAPDSVTQISANTTPDYILTIENLASYNRHCREIVDNGVVLFSSGFPSPGFCQMLTLLGRSVEAEVPFYHWSDIDLGGLRIFRRIAGVLHDELGGKELHPHLMTAEVLSEYAEYGKKKTDKVLSNYERIKKDCPQLTTLIDRMLIDGEDCLTLEQENLSPQSVL